MEFISFIEGTETSSAEGLFRMESAEFSTSLLPLTPFYPEPGNIKDTKGLNTLLPLTQPHHRGRGQQGSVHEFF